MMHKTLIMGTWPIYKKTLPTTDLNKKNLSFDKISPRDFYFFFLSFQSVLVHTFFGSILVDFDHIFQGYFIDKQTKG